MYSESYSNVWAPIRNDAIRTGLGAVFDGAVIRCIHQNCPVDAIDELASRGDIDTDAWAPIRARVVAEIERLKAVAAKSSREYRARKRQQRVEGGERACPICTKPIKGKRADAVACSDKCRVRYHRQQTQLRYLAIDPNMNRFKPSAEASE